MRITYTHGFTLVELLVTLAIMAITLTLGVPSFKDTIRENRLAGHSNRFLSALNIARSEAIKRGAVVTVCKANVDATPPACNGNPCDSGGGANCWEKGWLVFTDTNGDGVTDPEETVIRVFEGLPKTLTLRVAGNHDSNWIAYDSIGEGKGSGAGGQPNDTFRLCQGQDAANGRKITINTMGRANIEKGTSSCP